MVTDGLNSESVNGLIAHISSCMASCLAKQTALSELLLDCTMTRTIDAVFRIVFSVYICLFRVYIGNGDLK